MSELKIKKSQHFEGKFTNSFDHVSTFLNKNKSSHQMTNELSQAKIERKLSVEFGINLKESEKEQYLVALDESRDGTPVILRVPPFKNGQEPTVITDEGIERNIFKTLETGRFTLMRNAPEVNWINDSLEREAKESLTGKMIIGALDWAERVVSSQLIDLNIPNDFERRKFIESAVTLFHKCVLLTKDEFDRSKIVGEEIFISKDRTDLGRPLVSDRGLER